MLVYKSYISNSTFRVIKNKAVVCIPKQLFELNYVNTVHPSTETIMSYYTSFVVPRGSPLQAKSAFFLYLMSNWNIFMHFRVLFMMILCGFVIVEFWRS